MIRIWLGLILFIAIVGVEVKGANVTVCASGCDYTSPLDAYNAVSCSVENTITITAGETFTGATSNPYMELPWKADGCKYIEFRSSLYAQEPPPGVRVTPGMIGLMPQIRQGVHGSIPILRMGQYRQGITGVDTTNNTLTVDSNYGLANGAPISCNADNVYGSGGALPGGITGSQIYFIGNLSSLTFKLYDYVGGNVIDITSSGSGTNYCTVARSASNIGFRMLAFVTNGFVLENGMVEIGIGYESSVRGMVNGIRMYHCLVLGSDSLNGPRNGLYIQANNVQVRDSYVYSAKFAPAGESHAVFGGTLSHNVAITNTTMNGASMSYFTGGAFSIPIYGRIPTNHRLVRNYKYKSGFMLYMEGAGAPSGTCFPGRFYRNLTPSPNTCANSACYTCSGSGLTGTWGVDTGAVEWTGTFLTKAITELKGCVDCLFEGNVTENGFEDADTGNPGYAYLLSQVDGNARDWMTIKDTIVRNNYANNVWRGLTVGITSAPGVYFPIPVSNVHFDNNLLENMANTPAMAIHDPPVAQSYPYRTDRSFQSVKFSNNTTRGYPSTGTGTFWMLIGYGPDGTPNEGPMVDFKFQGNIGQQPGTLFVDGGDGTCGAGGLAGAMVLPGSPPYPINAALMDGASGMTYTGCVTNATNVNPVPYVSASDSRLTPLGPYSADCVSGCAFTAPNGKDMGVDVDMVLGESSNVVAGTRGWMWDLKVKVGSTRAVVSYTAPTLGTCDLTIYDSIVRIAANENADTNTAGEKLDSRTGNVTQGFSRQFVLGTNTALTASTDYTGKLSCDSGAQFRIFSFRTSPALGVSRNVTFSYATARAGEYSSSADMSSATSIGSGVENVVPVPAAGVRYYRQTGPNGLIWVVVSP